MIETMPNILSDVSFRRDIDDKVKDLMGRSCSNLINITENIAEMVKEAASWGMDEGFRIGWRIHEHRTKKYVIETMPNPLSDKGIKEDIDDKVKKLMGKSCSSLISIKENITDMVKTAAEWGMAEGFRIGWRIHEHRTKNK
jgi:hypothetical protein